jgi:hypothetical protein
VLRQKFEFKVEKAFKARLGDPRESSALSELLGGITRIVHESGRVLWHGGGRSSTEIDFPKGTITAYRDLRAIDPADADRQKSRPLVLRRKLAISPVLGVYPDASAAAHAKREGKFTLAPGRDHEIHFEQPSESGFKEMTPVPAWILGEVEVVSNKQSLLKLPVIYHRGSAASDTKRPAGEPGKPKRTPLEEAREELFQKQLALVKTLRTKKDAGSVSAHTELLAELRTLRPDDPSLAYEQAIALASRAGLLENKPRTKVTGTPPAAPTEADAGDEEKTEATPGKTSMAPDRAKAAEDVLARVAETIAAIDAVAVAAFFGAPEATASDDRETRRVQGVKRKEMTAQRDLLRDFALLRTEIALNLGQVKEARSALQEAQRWEQTGAVPAKKWRDLEFSVLKAEGYLGLALQSLQEHVLKDDPGDRMAREKRVTLLRELGWTAWAEREQHQLAVEKGSVAPRF